MISTILEHLLNYCEKLSVQIKVQIQQFYKDIITVFPSLAGPIYGKSNPEIEKTAEHWIDRFFKEEITSESFVNTLEKWKNSETVLEKEFFASIITNLFCEF